MATKQPAVVIPVRLDSKQAEKDAKGLKAALGTALKGVAVAGAAAGAALVAFGAVMLKAAKAASIQEAAELKLVSAIRTRAEFTQAEFEALSKFNSATQQATNIGDERLLQLQAQLTLMGVSKDRLQEATRATIGLTESTGNLQTSSRLVARALQGDTAALKRYGIQATTSKDAIDQMSAAFAVAEQKTKTVAGQVERFQGNLGDMNEVIGAGVIQSGALSDSLFALNKFTLQLTNAFKSEAGKEAINAFFQTIIRGVAGGINALIGMRKAFDDFKGFVADSVSNFAPTVSSALRDSISGESSIEKALSTFADELLASTKKGVRDVVAGVTGAAGRPPGLPGARGAGGPSEDEGLSPLGAPFDVIQTDADLRLEAAKTHALQRNELDETFKAMRLEGAMAEEAALRQIKTEAVDLANEKRAQDFAEEQAQAQSHALVMIDVANTFSSAFASAITAAIVGGENFGAALKKATGQAIIGLGTQLVQAGIAATLLGTLALVAPGIGAVMGITPAAIGVGVAAGAAGVAMIALGGALGGGSSPGGSGRRGAAGGGRGSGSGFGGFAPRDFGLSGVGAGPASRGGDTGNRTFVTQVTFNGFVGDEVRVAREIERTQERADRLSFGRPLRIPGT